MTYQLYVTDSNVFGGSDNVNYDTWTTVTLDLSSLNPWTDTEQNRLYRFRFVKIGGGNFASESLEFRNFELKGSYDYATHVDGEIEDTWDFEDSLEYFYDVESNVSDFDDGTTEGWLGRLGSSLSNADSEYLKITDGDGDMSIYQTGLSIPASGASGYDYLIIEFNSSVNIDNITIKDAVAGNQVCFDDTGWSAGVWSLFTCDLDLDGDWTGTETALEILSITDTSTSTTMFINFIGIYDVSLGDQDGWNKQEFSYESFVHPEGYLETAFMRNSRSNERLRTDAVYNPDTTIFDTLKIRAKYTGSNAISFQFADRTLGTNLLTATTLTTSFVEYVLDFSSDGDWTSGFDIFRLVFTKTAGGNFGGDEKVIIDYILLLKSENETAQDIFTIGLYDQDNSIPLLNVTQHFWNNTYFQYRVYLMDSSSNVVSYYYSDNQTYSDVYYRAKITYNVLTSNFETNIKTDGGTQIFKASYPDDFTNTGVIPQLFAHEKSPDIFFSSYVDIEFTASETWIDFIEAKFKEQEWREASTPQEPTYYFTRSGTSAVVDVATADTGGQNTQSTWYLNIPYLDSISGTITDDITGVASGAGAVAVRAYFYTVDKYNGTNHLMFQINTVRDLGTLTTSVAVLDNEGGTLLAETTLSSTTSYLTEYSVGTSSDRENVTLSMRHTPEQNVTNTFYDFQYSVNVNDLNDNPSQEFVIRHQWDIILVTGGTGYYDLFVKDFAFLERDLFIDSFVDTVTKGFGIFAWIFDFFAGIFRWLAGMFGIIMSPFFVSLEIAITTFQTNLLARFSIFESGGVLYTLIDSGFGLFESGGVFHTLFGTVGTLVWAAFSATQVNLLWAGFTSGVAGIIWSAFETSISDWLADLVIDAWDAIWGYLGLDFSTLMNGLFNFFFGFNFASIALDIVLDLFNYVFPGSAAFLRGFTNISLGTLFSDILALINIIIQFGVWAIFLGITAHLFFFSFSTEDFDMNNGAAKMFSNGLKLYGWDFTTGLGNVTIPIRVNLFFIWILTALVLGVFAWILPFSII